MDRLENYASVERVRTDINCRYELNMKKSRLMKQKKYIGLFPTEESAWSTARDILDSETPELYADFIRTNMRLETEGKGMPQSYSNSDSSGNMDLRLTHDLIPFNQNGTSSAESKPLLDGDLPLPILSSPKAKAKRGRKCDKIERLVDHTPQASSISSLEFKVRWRGYSSAHDDWYPYAEVKGLQALEEYIDLHPEAGELIRTLQLKKALTPSTHPSSSSSSSFSSKRSSSSKRSRPKSNGAIDKPVDEGSGLKVRQYSTNEDDFVLFISDSTCPPSSQTLKVLPSQDTSSFSSTSHCVASFPDRTSELTSSESSKSSPSASSAPRASPLTPEQLSILQLKKRKILLEREILKKELELLDLEEEQEDGIGT